ncbi:MULTISPECIES: cytochrome bd oxidase small subunit CydS [Solibacillus]
MSDFLIFYAPFMIVLLAIIAAFVVATKTKSH